MLEWLMSFDAPNKRPIRMLMQLACHLAIPGKVAAYGPVKYEAVW